MAGMATRADRGLRAIRFWTAAAHDRVWFRTAAAVSRRILILANPTAGGGRARQLAAQLAAELAARAISAEVRCTTHRGHAEALARAAGDEPWDALVAVGGDGTVLEVLNGMPDPTRPLAVLPVGTANVLAAEYHLPRRPAELASRIDRGATAPHAIGLAGSRRFLLFCGAGHDGAAVQQLEQQPSVWTGKKKWFRPIARVIRDWPAYRLSATLADGETLTGLTTVLVTRVRNYGGAFRLTPGIDPRDGNLHVLCFRARSRTAWVGLGIRAFLRRLQPSPQLLVRTTNAVRIDGESPYHLDGDFAGETPVDVRLEGRAARLFTL